MSVTCNVPETPKDRLRSLVSMLSGTEVLVIGDSIVDRYRYLVDAKRPNPENPSVGVWQEASRNDRPGGAAAVAAMVDALGASAVRMFGFPQVKCRVWLDGNPIARIDGPVWGANGDLIDGIVRKIRRRLGANSGRTPCAVIFSDYGNGIVCRKTLAAAAMPGRMERVKCVLVDPRRGAGPEDLEEYMAAKPHVLTPNSAECESMRLDDLHDLTLATAITLGERGVEFRYGCGQGRFGCRPPFVRQSPVDPCGAGDQFAATMALARAAGGSWRECVDLAQLAAGIQVCRQGAVPVTRDELLAEIDRIPESTVQPDDWRSDRPVPGFVAGTHPQVRTGRDRRGLVSLCELQAIASKWRGEGRKIVFTNGCFDLLHPGHLSLLKQASGLGDRLVVAVNSDLSVRDLKGPGRPIHGESHRAETLASMEMVDAVVVFHGDSSPLKIAESIRADVVVKGFDSKRWIDSVSPRVESWGGRCHLATMLPGKHTTDIIREISGAGP